MKKEINVQTGEITIDESFTPPEAEPNTEILVQIEELEAQITARRFREAVLSQEGADWLSAKEAEISSLRSLLT